jgi:hypothetical protein
MVKAAQPVRRFAFHQAHAFFLGVLLFAGCGKQSGVPKSQPAVTTHSAPPPAVTIGPGPGEKVCFGCQGEGTITCRVPGCQAGQMDCPATCLKLTRGRWEHKAVPGHDPSELWITFRTKDGTRSWNHSHVGEVIQMQNGDAVNIGRCKNCGGTTKVTCSTCKGMGSQTCLICAGKKFIPNPWTPTNNPWFNGQPDVIRLKDGRVLLGRVAAAMDDDRTIVTRDKQTLHVKASDILPRTDTNAAASQASPAK